MDKVYNHEFTETSSNLRKTSAQQLNIYANISVFIDCENNKFQKK